MPRIFMSLDETNPLKPIPCMHINGSEIHLIEAEVAGLIAEMEWIKDSLNAARSTYWATLANKYKEVQNAD